MTTTLVLPASPDYFPPAHGRYDVAAGLKPLGDKPNFEIDRDYMAYMQAKAASCLEHQIHLAARLRAKGMGRRSLQLACFMISGLNRSYPNPATKPKQGSDSHL